MRLIFATLFIVVSLLLLRRNQTLKWVVFIVYISAIIYFAFLIREPMPIYHYSIRPLGAARKALEFGGGVIPALLNGNVQVVNWVSLEGIVLNILLFIPFGYLVPFLIRENIRWPKLLLFGLLVSLGIEIIQLATRLGFADIDDLINNTIGTFLGYVLYKKALV